MLTITLSHNASQIARRLERFPAAMLDAVAAEIDLQNQGTIRHVVRARYTAGKGPFHVSERKLGAVSRQLRRSLYATPARVVGQTVASAIGTPITYARVHEFGFTGTVNVPTHDRVSVKGLVHQVRAHTRRMNLPARAPLRAGIEDRLEQYGRAISRAIVRSWRTSRT